MNALWLQSINDIVLTGLWRATWQASLLAGIVLLIQWVLGRRLGGRGRYLLWSIVILRLLLPVLPQSSLSIFNLQYLSIRSAQVVRPPDGPLPSIALPVGSLRVQTSEIQSASPPATPTRLTTAQLLLSGWLLGLVLVGGRLVIASRAWRVSLGVLREVDDPSIQRIAIPCVKRLSLKRVPAILAGSEVRTPAVVGLWRPQLLLPESVLRDCSAAELRLILLHELAHVKRHDIAANWLLALASIIHWFNPLIWLTAARIRADRELACDETVLACSQNSDPREYGQILLKLIEILSPPIHRQPQLVGILETSAPMQRRMRMIARYTPQSSRRWIWITLVLLALAATALTDSVRGQARSGGMPPGAVPSTQPAGAEHAKDDSLIPPGMQPQLSHVLPELKFDAVPFSDVIDFLRDVSGANIFVNWRALETAGVDKKAAVTMRLREVPFEQALRQVLRDVGGGSVRLSYVIEGNVLTITTEEDASNDTKTVFYDVGDLLVDSQGKALGGNEVQSQMAQLVAVIQDTLARETWRNNGGNTGSIQNFNGRLIITQTAAVHRQIENLLLRLREKPTTQPRPLVSST